MTTINNADWTVLQLDGVADVAQKAASKVAAKFINVIDYDDLHQDAVIILASHRDTVQGYIDRDELGYLFHWLWCDLTNIANREATKKNRQISYEALWGRAA